MRASMAVIIPMLLIGGIGCGATTEILLAPFELTSDFTSSTTPGATAYNGHAKARQQLETFVAYSYENVSADIARGEGEYLVSLATLAGVPSVSQPTFGTEIQRHYGLVYEPNLPRKETLTRIVNTAWSAGYGRPTTGP